jgi:hypothetical protein
LRYTRRTRDLNGVDLRGGLASLAGGGRIVGLILANPYGRGTHMTGMMDILATVFVIWVVAAGLAQSSIERKRRQALNQDWLRRFGFLPITISNRAKRQKYKVFRGLRPDQDAWWIMQKEAENDNILNLH